MKKRAVFILMIIIIRCSLSLADSTNKASIDSQFKSYNQKSDNGPQIKEITPAQAPGKTDFFITNKEAILSICILLALLIVVAGEIWLVKSTGINYDSAIKLIIVSLVIMSALLVIMGGYDEHTIAPAFGLFGTLAGYVLGKSSSNSSDKSNETS